GAVPGGGGGPGAGRLIDELLGVAGPVEEREVGVAMQLGVHGETSTTGAETLANTCSISKTGPGLGRRSHRRGAQLRLGAVGRHRLSPSRTPGPPRSLHPELTTTVNFSHDAAVGLRADSKGAAMSTTPLPEPTYRRADPGRPTASGLAIGLSAVVALLVALLTRGAGVVGVAVLFVLFVPLEKLFAFRPQKVFRRGFLTDMTH